MTRDDAVGNQFYCIKGAIFGTIVAGVDDFIAPDDDLCAVFVHLVGFEFTDDLGVGYFFVAAVGTSLYRMTWKVSVPSTHCVVSSGIFPTPWQR